MSAETLRRRLLNPLAFRLYLWRHLPLAAFAGLKVVDLDDRRCSVRLPGGWRTTNPFQSTYFAAQAMAAEMSTGAPATLLTRTAPTSISMLVRGVRAKFSKKATGTTWFIFDRVTEMKTAVERAGQGGEGETFVAHSTGRMADKTVVAEFEVTWSFKRRG